MHQDDELNLDQKLKIPQREIRPGVDFLKALDERSIGYRKNRFPNSNFNLQACSEDELVKKQFKEMRCEMPGIPRSTFLMVFSPDGTKLASTHGNHNIYITDVRTGKNVKTLMGHPRTPWCIAFHPTSNQIIASGCLGGQVRVWDLSGGSEMWTAESQTVISSIAFHPSDRLLVIATNNELFFWDWSTPEPFMHLATSTTKEKVRYVAFDKLGNKLITGITNCPQTRWERVRALVPVPRPAERTINPHWRRITPRMISNTRPGTTAPTNVTSNRPSTSREPLSSIPERERRITTCYRDLVHQYEVLVHRYLQIYRPPVMIDQGTDPMEMEPPASLPATANYQPSTSAQEQTPAPSTSQMAELEPIPSTSAVLRKSSATQPSKNKSKKLRSSDSPASFSDSASQNSGNTASTSHSVGRAGENEVSSSGGSHTQSPIGLRLFPRETGKTIGCTQTSPNVPTNDAVTASLSSSSPQRINTNQNNNAGDSNKIDFRIQIQRNTEENNSSSEDEERLLNTIIEDFERRNSSDNAEESNSNQNTPSTSSESRQIQQIRQDLSMYKYLSKKGGNTKVRRERLSPSMTRVTMTRRFLIPSPDNSSSEDATTPTNNPTGSNTNNNNNNSAGSSAQESTYKMKIKCSVTPNSTEGSQENQEKSASSPKASTSGTTGKKSDHISDLIRNVEIMLAQFRQNLKQRGQSNVNEPSSSRDKPSTSSSTRDEPSTSKNPPKGIGTQLKGALRRSYPYAKKAKRLSWSDSSSSDEEQKSKRGRTTVNSSNNPNIDHSYAGPSTSQINEHSYAGLTENIPNPENNTMRIKIDLSPVNEEQSPSTSGSQRNPSVEAPTTPELLDHVDTMNLERELSQMLDSPEATTETETERPNNEHVCNTCGGSIADRCQRPDNNTLYICSRSLNNNNNNTPSHPTSNEPVWCRVLSNRLSAFHPTRLNNRGSSFLQPFLRNRLGNLSSSEGSTRSQSFAPDELINFSERMSEDDAPGARGFHPFDPPPELMSIHPENIGIGNMYSNIVRELESSLNDVRNIRYNTRLGDTSDMLSSFSERLESIMTQSNAILRNLSTSLDTLPAGDGDRDNMQNLNMNVVFNSLRDLSRNSDEPIFDLVNGSRRTNPLTSDHTYPLNPENPQIASMSPLMVSLHLTVSHIQRQARLLRQQVESIERIDRAMLEVAQLQMMRQMFDELHRHFSSISGVGVSSVRQMMAGTRISDSSNYDSPPSDSDNTAAQNQNTEFEPQASTSTAGQDKPNQNTGRNRSRKTIPRFLFIGHRQLKRTINLILGTRRRLAKERILKRNIYRRFVLNRPNTRPVVDVSSNRISFINSETLTYMTARLEQFLMEHGRFIGRSVIPVNLPSTSSRSLVGEHIIMLRLGLCRRKMNRILGLNYDTSRNNYSRVTVDGSSRFAARQTLSSILDTLTRYMDGNANSRIASHLRSHIWEVIELSLLLSEILLLQIVDSIPPPSGMNLDPERESLSMRIDQMCSRMLQNRLSGQSHQLTRSLRLLRLTVRHANQALGQTYTARRNAMLPTNSDDERLDSRQGLLYDIHNCLRNIRRHRETSTRVENTAAPNPTGREWYRTINDIITRYTNPPSQESGTGSSNSNSSNSVLNNETGEETRPPPTTIEDANSSDENNSNPNNSLSSRERISRPLYRTSNIHLLNNEEGSGNNTPRNQTWNVPTVTVNDVPIGDPQYSAWHSRFLSNRQRLSDRLDELRNTGGLFRPRFLHPMYTGPNPFEPDLDDLHREQMYDGDIIANITPNHRIQVWEFTQGKIPNINNALKNVVVTECKIHNDASVDYASDGSILVALLPSGGYMNISNRLGVYSLEWQSLGQCLYQTSFEQNAVSVSLSPLNRYLIVGLASRRIPIMPSDKWTMAQIFLLDEKEAPFVKLSPIRELEQNRDTNYMSVNCIRWLPTSGQGLVFATNTGQLRFLT